MDSVRLDRYIALYSSENGHNEFGDDRLIGGNHLEYTSYVGGIHYGFKRGRTELEDESDQFIEALRDDIDGMYRRNAWDIRDAKSEPEIDIKYYKAKSYAYKVFQDVLGDSEKVKKMKAEAERVAKEAAEKAEAERLAKEAEEKARQDAEIEKERAKSNEGLSIAIDQATEKNRQAINDRLDEAEKEFRQASEKLHRMSNQQDTCSAGSGTCRAQGDTSSFSNEQKTSSALDVIDKELKNLKLLPENENKVRQTLFEDPFIRVLKEGNVQQLSEEANTGSKNPYSKVKPSSAEDIKGKIITALGNKLGNRVLTV